MKKSRKIAYIFAATAGISLLSAAAIAAGYGNGDSARAPQNDRDGSLFPGGACTSCNNGDKDGSLFPGGPCKSCTKDGSLFPGPCKKCAEREPERVKIKNYVPYTPVVYEATLRHCCEMAPLSLAHVDFRIRKNGNDGPYSTKLGNYRFRIFGCRRFDKEAMLNKGRVLEKNIAFNSVFEDMVGDCYKVLPMPHDLCLDNGTAQLPEYVLTAEITDYFMNVCDEYSWDKAQKNNARNGSSEITVVWRLMDLTQTKVYWKGESTGYGELDEGETNGEVKLIERAFADATSNLRNLPGFEERLSTRFSPQDMAAQRAALVDEERALNPAKCGYAQEYQCMTNCQIGKPGFNPMQCQPCQPCLCQNAQVPVTMMPAEEPIYEDGNVVAGGAVVSNDGIWEDGGYSAYGCAPCTAESAPEIVEAGGVVENGGEDKVLEDGGVSGDGTVVDKTIIESGDVSSTHDIINSCIDENGNVKSDGMCQVVDDTWVDTGDVKALDNFCVNATDPCKQLSPETVYRLRSSIVQIQSSNGRKGAGLLISDRFILTSADLVDKAKNSNDVTTVRNDKLKAHAVRINPVKNTALLMLESSTTYTPLALNLNLPEVGHNGFLTLGLLDVNDFKDGEDYLENSARVEGYRYSEAKGAEILANTFVQNVTVGGALIYKDCTINGMAPSGVKTNDGLDIFIPTETALRSLGISICGHEYVEESPWQQTIYKPVTSQIKNVQKAPEAMKEKDRK